jgi:DNA-binding NtrC family response regulator
MTSTSPTAHRVLIVDNDTRLRRALTELVNASDGFAVVATEGSSHGVATAATDAAATVALVVVDSAADRRALTRVRVLADQMPVVAVSATASAAGSATDAGATAFCEMDGNTDALVAALGAASTQGRTR